MTASCPCCGSSIDRAQDLDALIASLPWRQTQIMRSLRAAHRPMTRGDIANFWFENDPTGGPITAEIMVAAAMVRLRRRLQGTGWVIVSKKGSGGGYQLQAEQKARAHG